VVFGGALALLFNFAGSAWDAAEDRVSFETDAMGGIYKDILSPGLAIVMKLVVIVCIIFGGVVLYFGTGLFQ
jgi:hypothetical protein